MYIYIYLYTFTCKYALYFTDQKTYILSHEIVYKMALHVLVQRCVSMTSEAPEMPVFAWGGETRPHCSLHSFSVAWGYNEFNEHKYVVKR